MKKILMMTGFALAFAGLTGTSFAKSKAKSKSSKSSSSSSNSSNSKPTTASPQKKTTTTDNDTQNRMRKNTKTHHCRLPDGSINRDASQELCQKVGGKWTKY